jgi:hypothetical protein
MKLSFIASIAGVVAIFFVAFTSAPGGIEIAESLQNTVAILGLAITTGGLAGMF